MTIEKTMYKKAVDFIKERYPKGWGGAAVMRTSEDHYYISVAPEAFNPSVELCIETGAICEVHKMNEQLTHSICLVRDDENAVFKVLSPCGVCQERLRYFGQDVKVAVTSESLTFVTLKEMQPYHWTSAYPKEALEHYEK